MSGITVVSTACNAEKYARNCIASVRGQTIPARHIYIDAGSADDTPNVVAKAWHANLTSVCWDAPLLENLSRAVHALPKDEIVCWVDGDDCFATHTALETVAKVYECADTWLTFGQFVRSDGSQGFARRYPPQVVAEGWFRQSSWRATHLKTFRAGLFQAIPPSALQEADGSWIQLACDQAVMLAALELAGDRHAFIPDVLYHYNYDHSFERNATPDDLAREHDTLERVRAQTPLTRLEHRPW